MKLNSSELRAVLTIGTIIATRLLGIFLILPVFSVYTLNYPGATLPLAGVAFGIYALAQSLLQIPFGWASDRFGRKKILIFGLTLFSLGSLICGFADNIYELIFARILQGSGAVGSVSIAALGDSTRPSVRAQAFTITGIIIGVAFIISLIIGPVIASYLGFNSLFFILAILGILAILITLTLFPKIEISNAKADEVLLIKLFKNKEIKLLFVAAFMVSFALNLFLFIYPLSWKELNIAESKFWLIYLIVILPSAMFAYPYVRVSEKKGKLDIITTLGFIFLSAGFLIYLFNYGEKFVLILAGTCFFLGHTFFQAVLPTFLTQRVPTENRGTSSGFYNLANFFGASIGGMSTGFLYNLNTAYPIIVSIIILIIWFYIGLPKQPEKGTIT